MSRLAFVLALLALGGAGWAVYQVERARTEDDRDALDQLSVRLAAIERGLAELNARPPPAAPLEASPVVAGTAVPPAGTTAAPSFTAPGRAKATLEERLAALEKGLADTRAAGPRLPSDSIEMMPSGSVLTMPGFWGGVDEAAKALKLDDRQKARLDQIVEATNRELENLYGRPNEEGVLWKDVNEGLKFDPAEPDGFLAEMGAHMQKVAKFKKGKVPGTNETYAEAAERIRKEGKGRARALLDPEQARSWDRGHPDALFQEPGGNVSGTTMTFIGATPEVTLPAR